MPDLARSVARKWRDIPLAAEAAVFLFFAHFAVRWLPFRVLRRFFSPKVRPRPDGMERRIRRINWALHAAGKRMPVRAVCIHRGLAAQWLLARRGVAGTAYYGVRKNDETGAIDAHVWVMAAEIPVIGVDAADGFVVLATFPARAVTH